MAITVRARGALLATVLAASIGAVGAPAQASGGSGPFVLGNEYIKGFGLTDTKAGLKKPKKYYSGASSRIFIFAKLGKFKGWGSPSTRARAKKLTICDTSNTGNCSTTRKGTLTFKKRSKLTCDTGEGQMREVEIYLKAVAKQPPSKGFRKGRKQVVVSANTCPSLFGVNGSG